MSDPADDVTDLAHSAAEAVVATQKAALLLLQAEMQVLAQMIPGAGIAAGQPLPTEDEVEQGFDNMPV